MNWRDFLQQSSDLKEQARQIRNDIEANAENLSDEELEQKTNEATSLVAQARSSEERASKLEALDTQLEDNEDVSDLNARIQPDNPELNDGGAIRRTVAATARDREREAQFGFNNFGDFAQAVYRCSPAAGAAFQADGRLNRLYNQDLGLGETIDGQRGRASGSVGRPLAAATGLNQGIGAEGGWLIPPAFMSRIWDGLQNEADNLLQFTDQFPLDGAEKIELLANAETSRATGSRYGGIQGYWIAEADQMTASKPKVRKVKLEPHELAVLVYTTDRLLNAGGNTITAWLERAAVSEINWLFGDAIINGTGAGQPQGILNSGGLVSVAKTSGQAADTFTQANIADMWSRMHARSRRNAIWLVNQDVDPQLLTMFFPVTNIAVDENVGGFSAKLYNPDNDTILGRPIIRTEWNKTLGDKGDVILADLGAYATAFLQAGISSAMSMHLRFDYNETAFRFVASLDGQTWNASALTPANGANTLSPFVTLDDRA